MKMSMPPNLLFGKDLAPLLIASVIRKPTQKIMSNFAFPSCAMLLS